MISEAAFMADSVESGPKSHLWSVRQTAEMVFLGVPNMYESLEVPECPERKTKGYLNFFPWVNTYQIKS